MDFDPLQEFEMSSLTCLTLVCKCPSLSFLGMGRGSFRLVFSVSEMFLSTKQTDLALVPQTYPYQINREWSMPFVLF